MNKFKIIYYGTPDFAVFPLKSLLDNDYEIAAVVTAPDKPSGRGLKLNETAIKKFAVENGLKVLQPQSMKDPQFIQSIKSLNPDLQVVVAFRKLPEDVWSIPEFGTINLHASLLPHYRGAAPINWAIINGENHTGTTTFFINKNIDTGDIIMQNQIEIGENESAGELHDKLSHIGSELVVQTVDAIKNKTCPRIKQSQLEDLKVAPKLSKEICKINWEKNAREVFNFIRGLSPYPCAWTLLQDKNFKIFSSVIVYENHSKPIGLVQKEPNGKLKIYVKDGAIMPEIVQLEGKKRMDVKEFLRGFDLKENCIIGQC